MVPLGHDSRGAGAVRGTSILEATPAPGWLVMLGENGW